ncbi:PREDICTED: translation initiation factor IF-2-like [Pseudopodoces humilis]|uniref:translation initiation factor IF-2-like n=1 Tax=Pseudopodoces humilis TaxID=181119 RepID=UPI0006B867C5|nr:PREDICTED: translation initiation factor IF-2-like [Pseudopodoces humilis]
MVTASRRGCHCLSKGSQCLEEMSGLGTAHPGKKQADCPVSCGSCFRNSAEKINRKSYKCQMWLSVRCLLGGNPYTPYPGWDACLAAQARAGVSRSAAPVPSLSWARRWTAPSRGSPRPSESGRVLANAGDELFTVPSRGTKDLTVVAILRCYPFRAEEVPAAGTPPAPRLCGPPGGSQPPGQPVPAETPRPEPRWIPECRRTVLVARPGLGDEAAGSRPLQASDPGLTDPGDKVLMRWWWSLASTGRTSCRSSGSVTTSSIPRRTCRPAPEAGAGALLPHPTGEQRPDCPRYRRCGRRERSEPGRVWEGAGGGAGAALPAPKRLGVAVGPAGVALKMPSNKIWKDRCSVGYAPCPFRRRTLCESSPWWKECGRPAAPVCLLGL